MSTDKIIRAAEARIAKLAEDNARLERELELERATVDALRRNLDGCDRSRMDFRELAVQRGALIVELQRPLRLVAASGGVHSPMRVHRFEIIRHAHDPRCVEIVRDGAPGVDRDSSVSFCVGSGPDLVSVDLSIEVAP